MSAEQCKATLRKVKIVLDDADNIISALELELRGIPQLLRTAYAARLKEAQAREAQVHVQMQTQGLRAGVAASDDPYGEHAGLLSGTQTLEGSGRQLRDTQWVALEAEDQGADILRALRGQRETIESARDQVRWLWWLWEAC
ncbi:hypothetical protein C0992_000310 [Termitomyces sp. T32_za158]|nr:hypothetical protein C0992_000310 [Termitomyces sp. T32_za158]